MLCFGNAGAQAVGGFSLARSRDVVELAFDGEMRCGFDVLRTHAFKLTLGVAHIPGAMHKLELLEHGFDGVQVVIGVHVEHSVVLVIKLAVRFGTGIVALEQVLEVVVMAAGVPVRVHGHKACVLQKAGVNAAAGAREVARHAKNDVVFKPAVALVHGQVVDRRRGLACVDGSAHHGHAQGRCFAPAGHQGNSGQHGHRGLADADDVAVAVSALQVTDELLHVVDIVVQVEFAFRQGNDAGIFPVGDVDLVVFEHGLDGVAQQSGVMA